MISNRLLIILVEDSQEEVTTAVMLLEFTLEYVNCAPLLSILFILFNKSNLNSSKRNIKIKFITDADEKTCQYRNC